MGSTKTDLKNRCAGLRQELMEARKEIDRLKRKAVQGNEPAAARYRDFFQALPDVVYELDAEGKFVFISNTVQELGYTPEELIGKHFSTIVNPEVADDVSREKVLKRMKGKNTVPGKAPKLFDELRTGKRRTRNLEVKLIHKMSQTGKEGHTGRLFEYSEISAAGQYTEYPDSDRNEFRGTMGIIHDITEKRKAEQALRESEERFRAVFESAQDHIFIKDRNRRYTHMNPSMIARLGIEQDDVLEKTDEDLFGSYPSPHVRQQLSYIEKTDKEVLKGKPVHTVFAGRIPEGNISVSSIKVPLYDRKKNVTGICGISRDITEQRKIQEALRESEEKYRSILENTNDLIYSLDCREMEITYISSNVDEWGYETDDVVGKSIEEFVHPDDLEPVRELLDNTVRTGEVVPVQFRLRTGKGKYVWVEERGNLIIDNNPPARIVGVIRDISGQKEAEEALLESEEHFRMLTEMTSSAVFIHRGGRFIYANPACETMSGYTEEEILQKNFWDVIHPDMKEEVKERGQQRVMRELSDGSMSKYEIKIMNKSGKTKWIMYDAARIEYRGESAVMATAVDITDQKKAQDELRESEEKYRILVDNIPAVIFRTDTEGKMVFANRMFLDAVDMTLEELTGSSPEIMRQFLPEGESQNMLKTIESVLEKEKKIGTEVEAANREGKMGYFFQIFYPWYTANGTLGGVEVLGQDITELKQAQKKAQKLQKQLARSEKMEALGRLAAGVAHDLSNVLSPVVGYPEVLLSRIDKNDQLYGPLAAIRNAGEKAAAMTDDLLTIARRGVVSKEAVNLNDIAKEYINSPEHRDLELLYPGVTVTAEFDPGLKNTEGAPVHLMKTIMNLVSNAADAMPEGGEITIRTENRSFDMQHRGFFTIPPGEYTVLTVKDSGIGISKEKIGKIFDPFYSKKVKEKTGTGLGLTVVQGTMEDHNGHIDISSTENKGTVFDLYLPVTDKPVHSKDDVSIEQYTGIGTVLVVDEVKEQREIVHLMLTRLGYTVITAGSGEEAVDMACEHEPDLVLVEMIMESGMDGMEIYKRIIEKVPRTKAVLTGRYAENEILTQAGEMGITRFLKKPYTMQKLGMTVKEEMEKRE